MASSSDRRKTPSSSRNKVQMQAAESDSVRDRAKAPAPKTSRTNSVSRARRIAMPQSSRSAHPRGPRPQQADTNDRSVGHGLNRDGKRVTQGSSRRIDSDFAARQSHSQQKDLIHSDLKQKTANHSDGSKTESVKQNRKASRNAAAQKSRRKAQRRNQARIKAAQRRAALRAEGFFPAQDQASPALTRALVIFIIIAVLGLGCSVLYMAPIFPVKSVTVEGSNHLTKEEIAQIAAIPEGTTMLRMDTKAIKQKLDSSPWVKSSSVSRELPNTVKVTVKEREMAAVVRITSKETKRDELWAIDTENKWLMVIPEQGSEEAQNVPASVYADMENVYTITDVPYGPEPVPGTECTDAPVLNALKIVSSLSTEIKDRVTKVSATDDHNTILVLDDGMEISFGDATDIRTKERVCLKLMADYPGQIAYINVRVVDRPSWRSY